MLLGQYLSIVGRCDARKRMRRDMTVVGTQMRQFWGQQQRFFKEMANASKVEFVVAQAKEALSSGMSVVIGLQSTGESGMDKVRYGSINDDRWLVGK